MDHRADFNNAFFVNTVCGWIGYHQTRQLVSHTALLSRADLPHRYYRARRIWLPPLSFRPLQPKPGWYHVQTKGSMPHCGVKSPRLSWYAHGWPSDQHIRLCAPEFGWNDIARKTGDLAKPAFSSLTNLCVASNLVCRMQRVYTAKFRQVSGIIFQRLHSVSWYSYLARSWNEPMKDLCFPNDFR